MSILMTDPVARTVRFEEDTMWVDLADGRTLGVPLAYFPRLSKATPKQRDKLVISGDGSGLHWEELDEDICVKSLLLGIGDRTRS